MISVNKELKCLIKFISLFKYFFRKIAPVLKTGKITDED